MWTTIYVACGHEWAEMIEKILLAEGYIVKSKFFAKEGNDELFEIMVPSFEAEEIQRTLIDLNII
jgi:hypothetical protein